uniref:tetratricopeptide repeat protein n=1 Tax=Enterobacter cloacae TaxID=550 RepID=UPI0013D7E946
VYLDTAGWASHRQDNTDRALQLLREARLRAPENPDIRYHLAVVLSKTGRKDEARDELGAALKTGSAFASAPEALQLLATLN